MEKDLHGQFVAALKEVLSDAETDGSPLLIKRIPFICNDIRDIKSDMRWIKWIGSGIVGGIGLIALKYFGI